MAKGVFIHNEQSVYDDLPAVHYHFPKQYLDRARRVVDDWILYYESGKNGGRKSFTAMAKVQDIIPDLAQDGMFYAIIENRSYVPFERLVPFRIDGVIANSLLAKPDGSANGGLAISAVQAITDADFIKIMELGLPDESDVLPRRDQDIDDEDEAIGEVRETAQDDFIFDAKRPIVEVLVSQKKRSRAFRTNIIAAYDQRCAFTGMRLINGGGRAEVQAAHIKSVSADGPDSINNGLALSGTVHWMFDRGLLSVSKENDILVSRHINNVEEVDRLIVKDRKVLLPKKCAHWPHPIFTQWHRENRFKQ